MTVQLNTDRLNDAEKRESDEWVGGFYMEVYVDGWDIDKTITMDFHTEEIEFPKHACQNVRVVDYTDTSVTLVVQQQRWICCESFGCALRGARPEHITFTCGTLGSPPPSPPPLPFPPPPPSPPRPRPPPPPSPPPPPRRIYPPAPPPPPIVRVDGTLNAQAISLTNDPDDPLGLSPHDQWAEVPRNAPPPPDGAGTTLPGIYQLAIFLTIASIVYQQAKKRGLLPWENAGKGQLVPQHVDEVAKTVRAKPKKVDVRVERAGDPEPGNLELSTKGVRRLRLNMHALI